ncbi:MAG: hypothetical protein ACP5I4_13970 [Oceanipulchritudo sp.]
MSALMAQRRGKGAAAGPGTIAVVALWPDEQESWLTLPFYEPYREGISARLRELGYAMDVFWCDGSEAAVRRLRRMLRARGIQGLVIPQAHESVTRLPFDVSGFAAAYIGNGIREPHLSRVDAALDFDMRLAWRRARAAGYRRIGLVTWKVLTEKNEGAWMGSFLNLQRELPKASRLPPLELEEIRADLALDWVERQRPDALISENGYLLHQLRERYPALGCFSLAWLDSVDVDGVIVGRREIGAAVVDMVVAQLTRGERGVPAIPKRVLIEGTWQGA